MSLMAVEEGRCVRAAEVEGESSEVDGWFEVLIRRFLILPETGLSVRLRYLSVSGSWRETRG